jgi:hypothetical protein
MREVIRTMANNCNFTRMETNEYEILKKKLLKSGPMVDRTNRNRMIGWVEVVNV